MEEDKRLRAIWVMSGMNEAGDRYDIIRAWDYLPSDDDLLAALWGLPGIVEESEVPGSGKFPGGNRLLYVESEDMTYACHMEHWQLKEHMLWKQADEG